MNETDKNEMRDAARSLGKLDTFEKDWAEFIALKRKKKMH